MKWLSRILHHLSFQNEKFYSQVQEGSSWFVSDPKGTEGLEE